jgi:hypothetical protein
VLFRSLVFIPMFLLLASCDQFRTTTAKNPALEDKNKTPDSKGKTSGDKGKADASGKTSTDKGKPGEAPAKPAEKSADEKIRSLEGSVRSLKEKVMSLEKDVGAVKSKSDSIGDTISARSIPAIIDTTSPGDVSVAKNLFGSFLIACDGVTHYLTGYEVKLTIGNLTSARFDGYRLKVKWGDRTKEFKKTEEILPGTWKKVTVVLEPATAESMRKLQVNLEMDDIVLKKEK